MYGVRFADFIFFLLNYMYPITETRTFHLDRVFKNGGGDGSSSEPHAPSLDPPMSRLLGFHASVFVCVLPLPINGQESSNCNVEQFREETTICLLMSLPHGAIFFFFFFWGVGGWG